ncbi:MAG: ankyrin repeat domain-containing protein [Gemmatimonadales bacterium]
MSYGELVEEGRPHRPALRRPPGPPENGAGAARCRCGPQPAKRRRLHHAAPDGRPERPLRPEAGELLGQGADPKLASDSGATPLYAVLNVQWSAKALLYPQPTAHLHQKLRYLDLMKALLDKGADPNARLTKHLWYASYNFDLLAVNTAGATPFWRAAYGTDVPAMKLLIKYGADPKIPTLKPAGRMRGEDADEEDDGKKDPSGLPEIPVGGPGVYPIHAASGVGYGEGYAANAHRHAPGGWMPAVKYLIEELGADVNARDHNGYNAIHHAAARGATR